MALTYQDKVIVITGGNSGIGAALVAAFAGQGAKVVNFDLAEAAAAPDSVAHYAKCNVASIESVDAAVASVIDKLGRIDVLVNNAGVSDDMSKVADLSPEQWTKVIGVNLNGPYHTLRACIPHMLNNESKVPENAPPGISRFGKPGPPRSPSKASIVNICSVASRHGAAAGAAYTASKHGLLGLTKNTAWMYRHQGIRCNAVLPGPIATSIFQNSGLAAPNQDGWSTLDPFMNCMYPALLYPDAIVNAVLYLTSPGAENVNGAELVVDDAWTAA